MELQNGGSRRIQRIAKGSRLLGIKIIVVEPGPFKTDFFYSSIAVNEKNIADYQNTAAKRKVKIKTLDDTVMKGWVDNANAAKSDD